MTCFSFFPIPERSHNIFLIVEHVFYSFGGFIHFLHFQYLPHYRFGISGIKWILRCFPYCLSSSKSNRLLQGYIINFFCTSKYIQCCSWSLFGVFFQFLRWTSDGQHAWNGAVSTQKSHPKSDGHPGNKSLLFQCFDGFGSRNILNPFNLFFQGELYTEYVCNSDTLCYFHAHIPENTGIRKRRLLDMVSCPSNGVVRIGYSVHSGSVRR